MPVVICDRASGKCVSMGPGRVPATVPASQISFLISDPVDIDLVRWDGDTQAPALRPLTQQEIDDAADAEADNLANLDDRLIRAVALTLLDGINQERQARGAQPITAAQFKAAVKARL